MSSRGGVNNSSGIPNNVVNSGSNSGSSMNSRQNAQAHQQQATQPTVPPHMLFQPQVILPYPAFPNQRIPAGFVPAGNASYSNPIYLPPYSYIVSPQQHRSNAGSAQNIQTGTPLGANVSAASVGGSNTQQQQPPTQHQAQINQHTPHYLQQQTVNPTPMSGMNAMYPVPTPQPKAAKKIIPIIDPKTGQNILERFTSEKSSSQSASGGSGSAALTIDPPHAPQTAGIQSQSQVDVSHDATSSHAPPSSLIIGQIDHDAYSVEQRETANDVPPQPHTPVVSAIADGPSVDIQPKQSKNIKR